MYRQTSRLVGVSISEFRDGLKRETSWPIWLVPNGSWGRERNGSLEASRRFLRPCYPTCYRNTSIVNLVSFSMHAIARRYASAIPLSFRNFRLDEYLDPRLSAVVDGRLQSLQPSCYASSITGFVLRLVYRCCCSSRYDDLTFKV